MLVPRFWAEGRIQKRERNRQITVRRFGWSDISQEEAQVHADKRVKEAFDRVASGEKVDRRERKMAYNGAEGVPIREEILSYHGDAVVTRNAYGAQCLNTPNILFADIDFVTGPTKRFRHLIRFALLIGAIACGYACNSLYYALQGGLSALVLGGVLASSLYGLAQMVTGDEKWVRNRVKRFVKAHPVWHLRLYRTPVGIRALVMHQIFDPHELEVANCFQALRADPVYVRMCLNQSCFRARVSPKPWRAGIRTHINAYSRVVWPVPQNRMPARNEWIHTYEQAALAYASCRFIGVLGNSGTVHPEALAVQKLHDELCRAHTSLPIA